jgi:hypothetical protein
MPTIKSALFQVVTALQQNTGSWKPQAKAYNLGV